MTNNNNNRVTFVFKNPSILENFNQNIIKEYGSIKKYRIDIIENLLSNYNDTKQIQQDKPVYIKDNERLTKQINILENTIKDKENTIKELQKQIKTLENNINDYKTTIKDKETHINQLQTTIKQHQTQIETINTQITTKEKQLITKDNDYKHIVEINNKTQREFNQLQNDIKKYSYVIGSINNLSVIDRLLKRYPKEIKELQP